MTMLLPGALAVMFSHRSNMTGSSLNTWLKLQSSTPSAGMPAAARCSARSSLLCLQPAITIQTCERRFKGTGDDSKVREITARDAHFVAGAGPGMRVLSGVARDLRNQ